MFNIVSSMEIVNICLFWLYKLHMYKATATIAGECSTSWKWNYETIIIISAEIALNSNRDVLFSSKY